MLIPWARADTSVPRTSAMPCRRAAAAACDQPAVVSWSVRATTSSPAAAASATTCAGAPVPSDAVEWVWRSMRTASR